jgi:hypothetical protein
LSHREAGAGGIIHSAIHHLMRFAMTIQNNHFSTQLQNINRPAATERPAARGTSTTSTAATAASTAAEEKSTASPALPAGLVGNHVNTTA